MRAAITFLAIGLMLGSVAAAQDKPATDDPAQIALGKQVYDDNCAACHGANLEGQPNWRYRKPDGRLPAPPHDASGHTWHHDDETLFGITKQGTAEFTGLPIESDMQGFKDILSDAEIRAVIAYIKSTWPERIRRRQESINQRLGSR